jgi:hypothetical protein
MKYVAMFKTWEEVAQYEGTWESHVRILDGSESVADLYNWRQTIIHGNPSWPRLASDLVIQQEARDGK